jgi:phosphoglycerate kinase
VKNIRDIDIKEKKVLIRVDFNVPLDENRQITDDTRIRGALPTIRYALAENAKVIVCSHLGRPKGQRLDEFSLAPAAARMAQLLEKPVKLARDCVGEDVEAMAAAMQPGDVLMLENLRYHAEEQENDEGFSKKLASLADVFISDAFAVAHRAHASVVGITHHCDQCAAGFLLQKEMDFFKRSVSDPVRPLLAIIGGAKVSSKLTALENLIDKVDAMIIGGAMANTFLKSQGLDIGKSLVEEDLLDAARKIIKLSKEKGVELYLPVDCVVANEFAADAETKVVPVQAIPDDWMALDIGPASTTLFGEVLESTKTILWNGPMGAFEMDAYSCGTLALVQRVATSHSLSIVGGGDTNAAVHKAGWATEVSYMSTGGGAFLMLMEGKDLPGVTAIEAKEG